MYMLYEFVDIPRSHLNVLLNSNEELINKANKIMKPKERSVFKSEMNDLLEADKRYRRDYNHYFNISIWTQRDIYAREKNPLVSGAVATLVAGPLAGGVVETDAKAMNTAINSRRNDAKIELSRAERTLKESQEYVGEKLDVVLNRIKKHEELNNLFKELIILEEERSNQEALKTKKANNKSSLGTGITIAIVMLIIIVIMSMT